MSYAKASELVAAGISIIPIRHNKAPAVATWKPYQDRMATDDELRQWYAADYGFARVHGAISGNLETIDFDVNVEEFAGLTAESLAREFIRIVNEVRPGLIDRLTWIKTPRPGWHAVYRCEAPVDGNQKLAYKPTKDGSFKCVIETRGEGGYALCPGSPAWCHPTKRIYEHRRGPDLANVSTITADERRILLTTAKGLNERQEGAADQKQAATNSGTPGEVFNLRGTWEEILQPVGFTLVETVEGIQRWKRPGGTSKLSATTGFGDNGFFYAFSTNCGYGIEPGRGYDKFGLYSRIYHQGDSKEAARQLADRGFAPTTCIMSDADAERFVGETVVEVSQAPKPEANFPAELLTVPGFVDNLAAYIDSQAYKRQPVLAYAASLTFLAALIGRKIIGADGTRANLYTIALAPSGAGKDNARKIVNRLAFQGGAGLLMGPGDLTSGAAIESAVFETPSILFMLDEFGEFLKMGGGPNGSEFRRELLSVLLKLYTSSDSVHSCKGYARSSKAKHITFPNCCLYGTTVDHSFYDSLTTESVTGGFLPRCLVFEGDKNPPACDPDFTQSPGGLVEIIKYLTDLTPGGAFDSANPSPLSIDMDDAAFGIIADFRAGTDGPWRDDQFIERTIWTRAAEQAKKLALLRAVSSDHEAPYISADDAVWGCKTVDWLKRYLIEKVQHNVGDSESDKAWKAFMSLARKRGTFQMTHVANQLRRFPPHVKKWVTDHAKQSGEFDVVPLPRGGTKFTYQGEQAT